MQLVCLPLLHGNYVYSNLSLGPSSVDSPEVEREHDAEALHVKLFE